MVSGILEEWNRSGVEGVRDLVRALPPEEQIRVALDLYDRRELDALEAIIEDDFVHDMRPTGIPGMEVYRGPAGYRRFLEEWLEAFPDSHLEIETIETRGPALMAVVRQDVQGAGSGVPVPFTFAAVLTFADAAARTSEFHMDLAAARSRFDQLADAHGD